MGVIVCLEVVLSVLPGSCSIFLNCSTLGAGQPQSKATFTVIHKGTVKIPTHDGTHLGATIFLPEIGEPVPVVMLLRYFRGSQQEEMADFFSARGYGVVLVDCRGRGDSEGEWIPYLPDARDGFDAQEWIGNQEWCNKRIGTFGLSYNGFTQLMSASLGSDYLKCMVPVRNQQTNFGHLYNDGVPQLNVIFEFGLTTSGKLQTQRILPITDPFYRRLPLMSVVDDFPQAPYVRDWFEHSSYDEYWKSYGVEDKYGKIKAPAYFVTGWYDNLLHEGWRNFIGFREKAGSELARRGTRILVGPWAHGRYFDRNGQAVPPGAGVDMLDLHLRWYDFWLKDIPNATDREPPIKIFVMGPDIWRSENEWPLARTRFTDFYLRSQGRANSARGDGSLNESPASLPTLPDEYVYDPNNPVPTLGGQISTHDEIKGPRDRRSVQTRKDVLVYTGEPLARAMEITGPIELRLFAASSAVDTDFTATLTDVYPDGRALHICEGIRRASFRNSLEHPTLIEKGRIYEYRVSLWETSYVFPAGHRIRLEISSSNFPRYARNLNTGAPLGRSARFEKARQRIFHSPEYPSRLILPVILEAVNP